MINKKLTYQLKGGMCRVCLFSNEDCSKMKFHEMQPISKGDSDGVVIVRCDGFKRPEN